MRDPLSKLSPATHRVIAAALLRERAHPGKPMPVGMVERLCEQTGASLGACLAIILGLARDGRSGELVRIGTEGSRIAVPDDETEAALDWRERIDPS